MAFTKLAIAAMALVTLVASASAARSDWVRSGAVAPQSRLRVTIGVALPAGAYDALVGSCQAVSDPSSASYAAYLTRDQVAELSQSDANVALVTEWLASHGVADVEVSPTRDSLVATMTAAQANDAFGARMALFTHAEASNMRLVRSETEPSAVPSKVARVMEVVVGISDFPTPHRSLMAEHRRRAHLAARVAAAMTTANKVDSTLDNAPATPVVGLMYVSDTQATLMTILVRGTHVCSVVALQYRHVAHDHH